MPWYFSEERYEVEYIYIYIGNVALALGLQTFKRGIKKQVMDLRYQDPSETSSLLPTPILFEGRIPIPCPAPSGSGSSSFPALLFPGCRGRLCCSVGTVSPFAVTITRPGITSPRPRHPEVLAGDTLGLSGTPCLRLNPLSPAFQKLQLRFTVLTVLSSYKFLCC